MVDSDERRQFWRATFRSPVELADAGGSSAGDLIDISLKGALVKVSNLWRGAVGDPCHLRLRLAEGAVIAMRATVAHVEGRRIGLRCESIDVDSITHLRRLVSLNAGDQNLLDRELAALIG